ncbi:AMP-binding protein [Parendozoicomonas sp. Alg238-R29]|uniref:AMP-binding protein n=1 Tax=Parendozoicomonas sp. Alg238-R29 TaxID=2993446 RepID=UPI00248DBBD4|nr:AMP-binding protein [Parendozoicomonas sp. Alg238-R29]
MDTVVPVTDPVLSIDTATLLHTIERAFDQFADQAAIEASGQSLTTYQLDEYCIYFAAYLQREARLHAGDVIAVQGVETVAGLVAVYGAVRAGLQILVLDKSNSLEQLAATGVLEGCHLRLFVQAYPGLFGKSAVHVFEENTPLLLSNAQTASFKKVLQKADASLWLRPSYVDQKKSRIFGVDNDQKAAQETNTITLTLPQPLRSCFEALITGQIIRF